MSSAAESLLWPAKTRKDLYCSVINNILKAQLRLRSPNPVISLNSLFHSSEHSLLVRKDIVVVRGKELHKF